MKYSKEMKIWIKQQNVRVKLAEVNIEMYTSTINILTKQENGLLKKKNLIQDIIQLECEQIEAIKEETAKGCEEWDKVEEYKK